MVGLAAVAAAQRLDPVQWSLASDLAVVPPGATVPLRLTATIQPGWHIYSLTLPAKIGDLPGLPTSVKLAENPAVAKVETYQPLPLLKLDPTINAEMQMYENRVSLLLPVTLAPDANGAVELTAEARYAACDDRQCLPYRTKQATAALQVDPAAPAPAAFAIPEGYMNVNDPAAVAAALARAAGGVDAGLVAFALTAFGFGLAAIFTPCVFPMIPITVSYFLNQKGGLFQAALFSLGIIALFVALGLGVTAATGPFGVVRMSANPWVNGFIAAVFGVFALSLLGAFEITVPSSLLTRFDGASRSGGILGTLLMGLTFSLASFACVGPFVGPLLASSVTAGGAQPAVGMASFAAGLASPFFLLAAFPSLLKKLPRSGGWLARVKVVMGFLLLAAMFKYLSTIDQVLQTGILTRERFLAAWVVLLAMAGLYLLGLLRLEGVEPGESMGVGRLLAGGAFLILALSLIPGMFGAPLGELDAYVPAARSSALGGAPRGPEWMQNEYEAALARGRAENKLILVNFTGYACTNCHWMKANMFPRPEVAAALERFVRVELYTDGLDEKSKEFQRMEEERFQTVAQPFYVIMDADENEIARFSGLTRKPEEFIAFLSRRPVL
jgi:thiol:disulfide interchange protein